MKPGDITPGTTLRFLDFKDERWVAYDDLVDWFEACANVIGRSNREKAVAVRGMGDMLAHQCRNAIVQEEGLA